MTGIFFARCGVAGNAILDHRFIITCLGGFLPAIAVYSKLIRTVICEKSAILCRENPNIFIRRIFFIKN